MEKIEDEIPNFSSEEKFNEELENAQLNKNKMENELNKIKDQLINSESVSLTIKDSTEKGAPNINSHKDILDLFKPIQNEVEVMDDLNSKNESINESYELSEMISKAIELTYIHSKEGELLSNMKDIYHVTDLIIEKMREYTNININPITKFKKLIEKFFGTLKTLLFKRISKNIEKVSWPLNL